MGSTAVVCLSHVIVAQPAGGALLEQGAIAADSGLQGEMPPTMDTNVIHHSSHLFLAL
jgi:hypothetical protein